MNQLSKSYQPLKIIIPVYNEGGNFASLYDQLAVIRTPFEAFVIYDFDDDNTIPAVNRVIDRGDRRFHLHRNDMYPGAAGALLTGFRLAAPGPVLVVMADLSDDLARVDRMVELYRDGYHLVAASRYARGGSKSAARYSNAFCPAAPAVLSAFFAACQLRTLRTRFASTTQKCSTACNSKAAPVSKSLSKSP